MKPRGILLSQIEKEEANKTDWDEAAEMFWQVKN